MKIEILTIGDELLSGDVVNTNAATLSEALWSEGFEVAYQTSVRDDPATMKEALLLASKRAQLVIVSGGLGPTADDFTLEIAAKTFKRPLALDENYLSYLRNLFRKWGRELSDNNKKQAMVPKGARTFQNRVGTAPGVGLKFRQTQFYFLPGVPKELKQIFSDFILPEILSDRKRGDVFESKILRCFGAAEADLDAALKDLYVNRLDIAGVRIGFRAHFPETLVKLSAWGRDPQAVKKGMREAEGKIREKIGKYIYGEGESTLEGVVGTLLAEKQKTVSVAESCTGGLIAHRITNIAGSSRYFKNGVVVYSNEGKMSILGVTHDIIEKHGAVSSQCAIEMAQGIRRISKTDFGIAVTGIAGPSGGTHEKPVGTVHIALADSKGIQEKKYVFPHGREWFKLLASSIALEKLRRVLLAGP